MIKSELIKRLIEAYPHLYAYEVEEGVELFFQALEEALTQGRRVELRGFGSFSVKQQQIRKARNPKTGETVVVPAKKKVVFKASPALLPVSPPVSLDESQT